MLITHAWPTSAKQSLGNINLNGAGINRKYYILILNTSRPEIDKNRAATLLPDYTAYGDMVTILLSILFGKRFENHGRLESIGLFFLPNIQNDIAIYNHKLSFNNEERRCDIEIPLNLIEFGKLISLFNSTKFDSTFSHTLFSAGRFYHQALLEAEKQPVLAYLNLITAGEILSGFYKYDDISLLDKQTLLDLGKITTVIENGQVIANRFKNKLFQVKKKFTITLLRLLSPSFFTNTEAIWKQWVLKHDNIEKIIKAAYDLRSIHVHTGIDFGKWVQCDTRYNHEIIMGEPVVENTDLKKCLCNAPTLCGLERIIRYVLLRFIHLNGIYIDERLNEDGLYKDISTM